jgi:hypothetical protein
MFTCHKIISDFSRFVPYIIKTDNVAPNDGTGIVSNISLGFTLKYYNSTYTYANIDGNGCLAFDGDYSTALYATYNNPLSRSSLGAILYRSLTGVSLTSASLFVKNAYSTDGLFGFTATGGFVCTFLNIPWASDAQGM